MLCSLPGFNLNSLQRHGDAIGSFLAARHHSGYSRSLMAFGNADPEAQTSHLARLAGGWGGVDPPGAGS